MGVKRDPIKVIARNTFLDAFHPSLTEWITYVTLRSLQSSINLLDVNLPMNPCARLSVYPKLMQGYCLKIWCNSYTSLDPWTLSSNPFSSRLIV